MNTYGTLKYKAIMGPDTNTTSDINERMAQDPAGYLPEFVAMQMRAIAANVRTGGQGCSNDVLASLLDAGAVAVEEADDYRKKYDRERALYRVIGDYMNENAELRRKLQMGPKTITESDLIGLELD